MSEQEMLENEITPEEDNRADDLPGREDADHLPTKPGWRVILNGIFYAAFCVIMAVIVIVTLSTPGVNVFGWLFVIVFAIGAFAAGYTCYDEFRHLKGALALDKSEKLESVSILDNWSDNYVDGGIATRKEHFHVIYRYADGTQYAKHSVKKSDAPVLIAGTKIQVQYLEQDPTIFRPLFTE